MRFAVLGFRVCCSTAGLHGRCYVSESQHTCSINMADHPARVRFTVFSTAAQHHSSTAAQQHSSSATATQHHSAIAPQQLGNSNTAPQRHSTIAPQTAARHEPLSLMNGADATAASSAERGGNGADATAASGAVRGGANCLFKRKSAPVRVEVRGLPGLRLQDCAGARPETRRAAQESRERPRTHDGAHDGEARSGGEAGGGNLEAEAERDGAPDHTADSEACFRETAVGGQCEAAAERQGAQDHTANSSPDRAEGRETPKLPQGQHRRRLREPLSEGQGEGGRRQAQGVRASEQGVAVQAQGPGC